MNVFIVGKIIEYRETGSKWEFCGVFDSEEKAKKACLSYLYFIGPAVLNRNIPDETIPWDGAYFPFPGKPESE
jgi:hypothetical protein